MSDAIKQAMALAKDQRGGKLLRCLETNEVAAKTVWMAAFAEKFGINPIFVGTQISRAIRLGMPYKGLRFVVEGVVRK